MLLAGFVILLFVQSKTNKTGFFLRGVPQASHGKSHGLLFKFNYY